MKKIIFLLLMSVSFSCIFGMEEKEEKWTFLRKINEPNTVEKGSDWLIVDNKLDLDISADDTVDLESFAEMIKKAQEAKIPYILIGLRSEEKGKLFYHFLHGSFLPGLATKWEIPASRRAPDAVEIYVAGKDGEFTFLYEMDSDTIKKNFLIQSAGKWQLKKELLTPGLGHLLIANLLKQKVENKIFNFADEIAKLKAKQDLLTAEVQHATDDRFYQIVNENEALTYQIQKLEKEKLNSEEQKTVLQDTVKWYNWALDYLTKGSENYRQALQARDKLSNMLPSQKVTTPEELLHNVNTLTMSLQNLSSALI